MSAEAPEVYGKHLSAKDLLRNRGICFKAWNEWDESSRSLPKIGGNKQFEPNGSWLENKQIQKGLSSREFLLGIERVERSSQLASAEWLAEQKRAKVIKKTGAEWANFGQEINSNLYLSAEEALLLLETECLELIWEGIPLSIQQAYEILIESESSNCTLDEYRVYSQLTRLGYRLQRFYYEASQSERSLGLDEPIQRKKVIVDPENGLWMAGNNMESTQLVKSAEKPEIDNDVKEVVESIVFTINDAVETDDAKITSNTSQPSTTINTADDKWSDRKMKNGKVEIISEQTILSPIKIVKDGLITAEQGVSKWPGARIQRNVKLLPKRNDKLPIPIVNTETMALRSKHEGSQSTLDKRKYPQRSTNSPNPKKAKHEIIELSDDEIEEIPKPMSRMEMLNCLPNVATQNFITENISKRYIPRGVQPKSSYRYDTKKLKQICNGDRAKRTNSESMGNGLNKWINENGSSSQQQRAAPCQPYWRHPGAVQHNYSGLNFWHPSNDSYVHNVNHFSANSLIMNVPGGIRMQQISIGMAGWQTNQSLFANNRWSSHQMNLFRNAAAMGYAMRSVFMQNAYLTNSFQRTAFANQQFRHRVHRYLENSWSGSYPSRLRGTEHIRRHRPILPYSQAQRSLNPYAENEVYQTTFTTVPGVASWSELKQKWRDAKTITIEDEDSSNQDEIQVVDQTVKPLISSKHARNFTEVYARLRIIKSAPDRTVRRKKGYLKISYNVYSNTQHYRKTNPGMPMFCLVISSHKENAFPQPVELNRLQQDAKGAPIIFACISNSSIAYIQPGIVTLDNLS